MSDPVKVIILGAVLDKSELTLYFKDGTSEIVKQGDARLVKLVEAIVPQMEATGQAEIDPALLQEHNHYAQLEEDTDGLIQFFRMARDKADEVIEKLEGIRKQEGELQPFSLGKSGSALKAAVADIMQNATPSSSKDFKKTLTETKGETTVVAVVGGEVVIPGIEQIDVQLQAVALKLGTVEGVKNFFTRLAAVKRSHSIQDLLKFMEKGELPIADDGSVLVYKRLQGTKEDGVFVDCHTRQVRQGVGSHAFMAESMVDPNRSNECSSGLHVARRDYLHSFSGDITVLAKLAPEDVIAVPHGDARKLRAKGYHIVARLSSDDAKRVNSNQPMADQVLLGNVARGNHVGILETVEITKAKGGGVIVKQAEGGQKEVVMDQKAKAASLDNVTDKTHETVDAAAVAKQLGKGTRAEQMKILFDKFMKATSKADKKAVAQEIAGLKKSFKSTYSSLGYTSGQVDKIEAALKYSDEPAKGKPKAAAKKAPVKKAAPTPAAKKAASKPATKPKTNAEKAKELHSLFTKAGKKDKGAYARSLLDLKSKSKLSWASLGLPDLTQKLAEYKV